MEGRVQLRVVILILLVLGIGITFYKRSSIGYPFFPKEKTEVWTIEAKVRFKANGEAVKLQFAVPGAHGNLRVLDESAASRDYGFTPAPISTQDQDFYRTVTWAKDHAEGIQELYYRVNVFRSEVDALSPIGHEVVELDPAYLDGPVAIAAKEVIIKARKYSADVETFTYQLNTILSDSNNQNVQTLLTGNEDEFSRCKLLRNLLLKAGYEAHLIRYLDLGGAMDRVLLNSAVLIVKGEKSLVTAFGESDFLNTDSLLAWQCGGPSLIELQGGKNAKVEFSIMEQALPAEIVQQQAAEREREGLAGFSLLSLSIEQQNAYRLLLMIPFGALVVVVMRNIIGIKTSGTFMPILLAMSFVKTELVTGILLFAIVVSAGLIVRSYLSKLNLLLVPRISSVVVVVIGIMVCFGVYGSKFEIGLMQSVTLFPTIILAWTVERLSILWEEDGAKEVCVQASGSLIVAVLAYFVMGNSMLRYQVFIFPEILFVVLAVIMALGQYTGYRVSELIRFAPFFEKGRK